MAASGLGAVGTDVTLYRTTVIATKNETAIEAGAVSANQVDELASLTPPSVVRGTYTRSAMGSENNIPVPGRIDLGEITFSVYFDASNTGHSGLISNDKSTQQTYIIRVSTGSSATTYYAFDGFITSTNLTTPADEQVMLDVTVALTTVVTVVDDS